MIFSDSYRERKQCTRSSQRLADHKRVIGVGIFYCTANMSTIQQREDNLSLCQTG